MNLTKETEITDGTVGKALYILDLVASFDTPPRFFDIEKISPFPKATTHRLLATLISQNMLVLDNNGYYSLGSRLIKLANKSWKSASIAPLAAPVIDELSKASGMTIHLAKIDNGQVLYLDKRNANRFVQMFSDAGKVAPVYCTGIGKSILAFSPKHKIDRIISQQSFFKYTENTISSADELLRELEDIRKTGFSFDREEHETGIVCIAIPILSKAGEAIAGISITLSTKDYSLKDLEVFKPMLSAAAKGIADAAEDWFLTH